VKVTFLDGFPAGPFADHVESALARHDALGPVHHLADEVFAPCQGCFECWTRVPGTCKANDAANGVMRDLIGHEGLLWTTRLRFGCWGSVTKAALDKSIGVLSPFFTKLEGETHHKKRYDRYPRWAALALAPEGTTEAEKQVFRTLVARNAINMHSPAPWVGFVDEHADEATLGAALTDALAHLRDPRGDAPHPDPPAPRPVAGVPPRDTPRRVLVWVGSGKPRGTSTSERLGSALAGRLADRGWESEILHASRSVRLGRATAPKLVEAFERADLVILAAPLYVDSLPALVLRGLGALADAKLERPPALLPIIQSGFPELRHNTLAVEIAALAAERLGMPWAGHFAMGGGGMLHAGLEGKRFGPQRDAFDRAAAALDAGGGVPAKATLAFGESIVPASLYRTVGQAGWLVEARRQGGLRDLWRRPFDQAPIDE